MTPRSWRRFWHLPALSLLMAVGSGCITTSSYHTARPLEVGTTEIGLALEAQGHQGEDGILITQPQVHARTGVAENVDLGFSAGAFGARAGMSFMLTDSEPLVFSVNPVIGLQWQRLFGLDDADAESSYTLWPMLNLLADYEVSEDLTFTFGLKPGFVFASDEDTAWLIGGSIGMRVDLEEFHVFPEINVVKFEDVDDFAWAVGVGVGFH